ncbi:MAG: hypothetical protein FJ246_00205 [Nitrospira sp.]|nr:hypothetical protein [Nitrospira sp.]
MKRTIGVFVCMAVLGIIGMPISSLVGAADSAPASKVAAQKSDMAKAAPKKAESYPEPVWSTDTEPPKNVAAPAKPKEKPYDGPIWSTDTVPETGSK